MLLKFVIHIKANKWWWWWWWRNAGDKWIKCKHREADRTIWAVDIRWNWMFKCHLLHGIFDLFSKEIQTASFVKKIGTHQDFSRKKKYYVKRRKSYRIKVVIPTFPTCCFIPRKCWFRQGPSNDTEKKA